MLQNLQFTGIGAGFNPLLPNTSAYFCWENQLILIDCGETVFARLFQSGLLHQYQQVYLLLTHTHADHAGSLPALVSYCNAVLHYQVTVVHPQPEKVQQLCSLMGVSPAEYRLAPSLPPAAGFACRFIPVQHVPDIPCFGLHLQTADWNAYYSGDAAQIPPEITEAFLEGRISALYQDTSLENTHHHASLDTLCQVIPPAHRQRVFCMHLNPGAEEKIRAQGFCIPQVMP